MRTRLSRLLGADRPRSPEPEPAADAPRAERQSGLDPQPRPRAWNLWELERLAEEMNGDSRAEERALLLLHLRDFADASGKLPPEFDPLVREAFDAGLLERAT
jgi:hypothetical protein